MMVDRREDLPTPVTETMDGKDRGVLEGRGLSGRHAVVHWSALRKQNFSPKTHLPIYLFGLMDMGGLEGERVLEEKSFVWSVQTSVSLHDTPRSLGGLGGLAEVSSFEGLRPTTTTI
jgi:hypothetical protein